MRTLTRIQFVLLALISATETSHSQAITFERVFTESNVSYAWDLKELPQVGFLLAGSKLDQNTSTVAYLVRTNSTGEIIWKKTVGRIGSLIRSIELTSDGGYLLAGTATSGQLHGDMYLIKTNSNGDTLWTKNIGKNSNDDYATTVFRTLDDNFVLIGYTRSSPGSQDVFFVKVTPNGDTLWTKTFGTSGQDNGNGGKQLSDGGFVIVGYYEGVCVLIRTDSSGNLLWQKTYGVGSGNAVAIMADGGFLITGGSNSNLFLTRTNAAGDSLWTHTYGGPRWANGEDIQLTTDSGFVVAGTTMSFGHGWNDVYILRLNRDGDTLWTRTFGSSSFDEGWKIKQCRDGGFIISGSTDRVPSIAKSIYLIKTNGNGIVNDVTLDNATKPSKFQLLQNYPNPFNPTTQIKFSIPYACDVTLKIFNLLGEEITTLISERLDAGSYKTDWAAAALSSGTYFYQFQADGFAATKKMLLIR